MNIDRIIRVSEGDRDPTDLLLTEAVRLTFDEVKGMEGQNFQIQFAMYKDEMQKPSPRIINTSTSDRKKPSTLKNIFKNPVIQLSAILTVPGFAIAAMDIPSQPGNSVRIEIAEGKTFYCDAEHPMLYRGVKQDHVLTKNETCSRLLETTPEVGKTIHFNGQIKVTGLENGDFAFRLKGDGTDIVVPSKNYKAIVEAWIISGGQAQDPLTMTFPFGKWRIESRLGTALRSPNSNACGMNQNMPKTLPELLYKFGRAHGYAEYRDSISRTAAKYGDLDYGKVAADPGYRALFNQICENQTLSSVLGMRSSIARAKALQEKIDNGEIILPDGRKNLIGSDIYISHLFGVGDTQYAQDEKGKEIKSRVLSRTGAVEIFYELHENPNKMMKFYINPVHYSANDYFMQIERPVMKMVPNAQNDKMIAVPVSDKDNKPVTEVHMLSTKEFYARLMERWGFDERPIPDMSDWAVADYHATGTARLKPYQPQVTFTFRDEAGKVYHTEKTVIRGELPAKLPETNDDNIAFNKAQDDFHKQLASDAVYKPHTNMPEVTAYRHPVQLSYR